MVVGHRKQQDFITNIIKEGNISHAYLFSGPERVGKTRVAKHYAQAVLCENTSEGGPCLKCGNCRLFEIGNQPDFLFFDSNENLNVDEVRDLIHFLELKPYQSKMKVALISHVEKMSPSGANSFLKTLEEPAPNTLIILTSENPKNLLPTIVSRTQVINFGLVSRAEIIDDLIKSERLDEGEAIEVANLSAGRVGLAKELARDKKKVSEIKTFLAELTETLSGVSLVKRLLLAENLAEQKNEIWEKLGFVENYYQRKIETQSLDQKELLKITHFLDKIAQSKDFIKKNVNPRLVVESLMLTGV